MRKGRHHAAFVELVFVYVGLFGGLDGILALWNVLARCPM
jgi:hypothetical protein